MLIKKGCTQRLDSMVAVYLGVVPNTLKDLTVGISVLNDRRDIEDDMLDIYINMVIKHHNDLSTRLQHIRNECGFTSKISS